METVNDIVALGPNPETNTIFHLQAVGEVGVAPELGTAFSKHDLVKLGKPGVSFQLDVQLAALELVLVPCTTLTESVVETTTPNELADNACFVSTAQESQIPITCNRRLLRANIGGQVQLS